MTEIVYIRMRKKVILEQWQELKLKDIAYISTHATKKNSLENTPIYRLSKKDKNILVIDSFLVIDHLTNEYPNVEFQLLGPEQTLIKIEPRKKPTHPVIITFVWLLLFVGSAMTIMNFHYDVSMQPVQQKLHFILTGVENEYPLWIQIPYSLGLGLGTILFFNHWFKKRFNEEPSPLEVEIFNYQQDLQQYINTMENEMNDPRNSS
ncbi:stage V sporulation protein AA [Oceanobacillus jeddahense]|uniref:Stage V sporulation protein AA n=1 Tax=Oceanobacillus jeddahense TaxID=1462527 RepID=A0ABY5JYE2_9BACI|nr:stage V sporulation protein AA [Oceanobacillus jeddahense]UUI05428.1 stage V sporulation protein AA [Oceanobacillus jeddahense]